MPAPQGTLASPAWRPERALLTAPQPAPDPYLEAVRRFGVPAEECAVFEDSVSGLSSALAARVGAVIGVATGHPPARLRQLGAHAVLRDYSEPAASLPAIARLLGTARNAAERPQ